MDAEFPEELAARPLKQQILVIKERFLPDGTSFEDHKYSKTLQLNGAFEEKEQNHTANHNNFCPGIYVMCPFILTTDHFTLYWSFWCLHHHSVFLS